VEDGIPAARKKARMDWQRNTFSSRWAGVRFYPPGWKPGSTAGRDACRYGVAEP
jgi:hypothetical protein